MLMQNLTPNMANNSLNTMQVHIIYTESEVILSTKPYSSWREIQDEFSTYKASLGPWGETEVINYLQDEYPDLNPDAGIQVNMLVSSNNSSKTLTFNVPLRS